LDDLYTQQLKCFNHCHDRSFPIPDHFGNGYYRSVCPGKGVLLFLEEYRLKRRMPLMAEGMPPSLGASYCISGRARWSIHGVSKPFVTRRGECELMTTGATSTSSTSYDIDEPLIMVNIMIHPDLITRYFGIPMGGFGPSGMLHPIETDDKVCYRKRPITGAERQIVRKLFHTPCLRPADRLFILSKVLELSAFQLELVDDPPEEPALSRESEADMAMISRAKSILESQMQSPPSLNRLARMLGTNETKLKKCFVSCCDTTAFGYLTACRMQRACELLKDDGLTLSQIGAEVGYSERTHFTRAFTRHFGMPPSRYRRRRLFSRHANR
jgi:AraC-like DNA-binding protein